MENFDRVYATGHLLVAGVMASSGVYGLMTGYIFGFGGELRHDMNIVWWSRSENPGYFWFTFGVNTAVCAFCIHSAVQITPIFGVKVKTHSV